jgi:hypothetical protein
MDLVGLNKIIWKYWKSLIIFPTLLNFYALFYVKYWDRIKSNVLLAIGNFFLILINFSENRITPLLS